MTAVTEDLIRSCWEYYAYEDAIVLAELNFSEKKTDHAAFLLATSYFRSSQHTSTYHFLKSFGTRTTETRFLFARCCEQLNKLAEAEEALTEGNMQSAIGAEKSADDPSEIATSYAHALLGRIYGKTNRAALAISEHRAALSKLPFLLESFKAIRNLGGDDDAAQYFSSVPISSSAVASGSAKDSTQALSSSVGLRKAPRSHLPGSVSAASHNSTPEIYVASIETPPALAQAPVAIEENVNTSGNFKTPFINPAPTTTDSKSVPKAPTKNMSRRGHADSDRASSRIVTRQQSQRVLTQNQSKIATRRSTRLFQGNVKENENEITSVRNEKLNAAKISVIKKSRKMEPDRPLSTCEGDKTKRISQIDNGKSRDSTSAFPAGNITEKRVPVEDEAVFHGLRKFADIEAALSCYDSSQAIDLIQDLIDCHRSSPLGLLALARAYFEQANYHKADDCFREIRRVYEYFVKGMEYYSTALWQLQKDMDLSALSQELTDQHRNAPESWCSAGNCFSLQKDNDTAIKFFQRAIQLNPDFAYAYTLLGHEYVAIEAYEQALQCFRAALRLQPRHYNAWFGIGLIYYKQEKLGLARLHLRRALEINPRNSVLMCHVSLVQQGLDDRKGALKLLDEALALSPRNILCRYHRAHLLFAQERHEDALVELTELKQLAPKEPMVYFLAGKVYKKIGEPHLALMNFSWATELDPRGEQHHPVIGDRRYDEEPVTALATMEPEDTSDMQAMDSDDSS